MAEPLALVGDVLVELLREGIARIRPTARVLLEQVRHAAEPPSGVSFVTEDGAAYTGLVLIDHNRVAVMLASRAEPPLVSRPVARDRAPLITPTPSPARHYSPPPRSFYEPEEPDDREWDEPPGYGRYK